MALPTRPTGPLIITMTYPDSPRNKTVYEWLARQFKGNLGVEIKLAPTEATAFSTLTKNVETALQLFVYGWRANYPDPQNWLSDTGIPTFLLQGVPAIMVRVM